MRPVAVNTAATWILYFHALIVSKIQYALCAWGGFLTQIENGMINAFLSRMYKYHFVSECFGIDSIVDVMDRNF